MSSSFLATVDDVAFLVMSTTVMLRRSNMLHRVLERHGRCQTQRETGHWQTIEGLNLKLQEICELCQRKCQAA
jgi:hypothetical protein